MLVVLMAEEQMQQRMPMQGRRQGRHCAQLNSAQESAKRVEFRDNHRHRRQIESRNGIQCYFDAGFKRIVMR